MLCCPECGSRLWICKECGWQGYLVVDFPDESLKKMKEIEKAEKMGKKVENLEKKLKKYY